MASATAALRREIERALPDRPLAIELWDGAEIPATREGPTLTIHSPRAIGHLLRAPGELGPGARLRVRRDRRRQPRRDHLPARALAPPAARPRRTAPLRCGGPARIRPRRLPPPPAAELRPDRRRHTKSRDAAAVRHHYDVSNEFFALFLDETMTYSCALFEEGVETLEDAQRAKLELICRKLQLEPGMRMLDIGCGWGSLAIHAAREHGASAAWHHPLAAAGGAGPARAPRRQGSATASRSR